MTIIDYSQMILMFNFVRFLAKIVFYNFLNQNVLPNLNQYYFFIEHWPKYTFPDLWYSLNLLKLGFVNF